MSVELPAYSVRREIEMVSADALAPSDRTDTLN